MKRVYFRLTGGAGKSQNYKGRDIFRCFLAHSNPGIRGFVFTAPGFFDESRDIYIMRARAVTSRIVSPIGSYFSHTIDSAVFFLRDATRVDNFHSRGWRRKRRGTRTDSSSYIGRFALAWRASESHIASNYGTFRWACPTDIPTSSSFILLKAFLPRSSTSLPRAEGSFF